MTNYLSSLFFSQFYTVVIYTVQHPNGALIPSTCFDPSLVSRFESFCDATINYLPQTPMGSLSSFIDLQGDHSQLELEASNMVGLISSVLEGAGIDGTGWQQ